MPTRFKEYGDNPKNLYLGRVTGDGRTGDLRKVELKKVVKMRSHLIFLPPMRLKLYI
jgi:hypothetical protein